MGIYENFFNEAKDLFSILTLDGQFREMSLSWETQLGWTRDELKTHSLIELVHPEDQARVEKDLQDQLNGPAKRFVETRFKHKSGDYRWLSWTFKLSDKDQMLFAMARDITDIRKNNLSLEALMASLDDLVFLIDETGLFIDLWTSNPGLLFLPKDKLIGHNIRDVFGYFGVGFESVMLQSFRLNKSLSMEFQFPDKAAWFSAKVTPIKKTSGQKRLASFLIRDISDKIEADQALDNERGKLMSASKMATLGEMAAGIAHEINNPLAIIQGKAWLLKKHLEDNQMDPTTFMTNLQAIHDTTNRISKIIHGLKTFARNADQDPFAETTISSIIDDTLELCREKMKNNGVQLRVIGKRPYKLECRGVQISQVVLNLLSNSFDAIVGTPDPWIELNIKNYEEVVEISVTDSGKGISQAIQEKIMQPFFTTKDVGKGTGLGLSITKGIIESHNGDFFYDKNSSHTRFVVRLPKKPTGLPQKLPA